MGFVGFLCGSLLATEPDGSIELRPEWHASSQGGRVLDLGIRPGLALRNAILIVEVPSGAELLGAPIGVGGATPEDTIEADGTRRLRVTLGDIAPAELRVIRFAFSHPPDTGAIVSIRVEGVGDDGPISEAVGVSVGRPGTPARRRHGAVEYRAVSRPEETP